MMRDWINLFESVSFHPAVLTIADGTKYIDYPEGTVGQREIDCQECEATGVWPSGKQCFYCRGSGKEKETVYNLPELNVSNANARRILTMLGFEDDSTGWIPSERLPELRRTLIRLKNTDRSGHAIEPSKEQKTRMDTSGDIPTITKGPTMYSGGFSDGYMLSTIERLLDMIDYAQKNGYGISWA